MNNSSITRWQPFVMALLTVLTITPQVLAQGKAPAWVTEGPYVDAEAFSLSLPIESIAGKLYVSVELGGEPRRFVFDTGSPSMIRSDLAKSLGLKVVDQRKGRDSHGAMIESDIVQAPITLGDVTFNKVPLFAADFGSSLAAKCLIGDGVLGSEILPLCAWQIDKPAGVLRCNTDLNSLDHIKDAKKQRLFSFGYPHTPYLDVQLAKKANSKAMFDTGSPAYLALSPPDYEGASRNKGIAGKIRGHGSLGGSLGGMAPVKDQVRAQLKAFSVGNVRLGRVSAHVREAPPSLLGAPLLDHFVLTLDQRSEAAFFAAYRDGPFERPTFGFALGFSDPITISLVWEETPASDAGLPVGRTITSINGAAVDYSCSGITRALEAMSAESIDLGWDGGAASLRKTE
ncbi:MAG: aspartyl protease family protein [Pseudomonadota bacterium]